MTEIEQLLRGIAAARREADVGNDEISCGITLAESEQLDEAADKLEALSRENAELKAHLKAMKKTAKAPLFPSFRPKHNRKDEG